MTSHTALVFFLRDKNKTALIARVYYTSKIHHADEHKVQEEWHLNFPVLNLDHNENLLKMDGFQAWADVVGLVFVMEQTFPPSPCKIQLTSDDKWRLGRTCLL